MRNRIVPPGVSALILVSVALLFISGTGFATPVHVETAGVSFVTSWNNHASSVTSIGNTMNVTVNLAYGTQIVVFGHVCWGSGAGGNLSVTDSVNTPYTLKVRDSWSFIPCQMVAFVTLKAIPTTQVQLTWTNPVGTSAIYGGVSVLEYSGVGSIGMTNHSNSGSGAGYVSSTGSQIGITTQSVNAWVAGHTLANSCGPALGNYPNVYFVPAISFPGKRVQFNNDPHYNECFTSSDSNSTFTSGGFYTQIGWNAFSYPARQQGVALELDPPVVNPPTQWNPPVPTSSSPGFFDWLPPLVFLAGVFIMASTVIYSGLKWFMEH